MFKWLKAPWSTAIPPHRTHRPPPEAYTQELDGLGPEYLPMGQGIEVQQISPAEFYSQCAKYRLSTLAGKK